MQTIEIRTETCSTGPVGRRLNVGALASLVKRYYQMPCLVTVRHGLDVLAPFFGTDSWC
jgi:hypothetical protein